MPPNPVAETVHAVNVDWSALFTATGAISILAFTALAVLLIDVALLRGRSPDARARLVGPLAIVGVAAAVGYLAWQWSVLGSIGSNVFYADAAGVLVLDRTVLLLQGLVLVLTAGVIALSIGWEQTRHVGEQLCLLLISAIGLLLMVSTRNLLMVFVALETVSVTLYILTAFHKGLVRSAEASMKYFMFGAVSAAFLLFGIAWVMGAAGNADMAVIGKGLTQARASAVPVAWVGMLFILVGLGFKLAAAPFHFWAPDAYQGAPTPITAFIATASKVASAAIALRLLSVAFAGLAGRTGWAFLELVDGNTTAAMARPGWVAVVIALSVLSMVWGNFAAISQRNVKRMLAYSSVAHAGYLLLGFAANDATGKLAVLYYLFAYTLTNLGAIGLVSALTRATGGDDLEDLDGLAQRSPLMGLLFLVFFLSLAGVPPLAGFFGKLLLFLAAARVGAADLTMLGLVLVALLLSAVSLYYYLTVLKHVFVHAPRTNAPVKVPAIWTVTLVLTALAVVALGVWPEPLVDLLRATLLSGPSFKL